MMNNGIELTRVLEFRKRLAAKADWNSWKFQLQNRIKREDLRNFFILSFFSICFCIFETLYAP